MASSAHHGGQNCEEATMAEIIFNTSRQDEQVREQVKAAVAAYRDMLDAFVNNRIQQAAAEAENAPASDRPMSPQP
jgi:hypothetical protein